MKRDHPSRRYVFGPYLLDARTRILTRDDKLLQVAPKAVETLIALVERAGEVVPQEELVARVWPDAFVEPNNLAQQISLLRDALNDRGGRPKYVETVPRRGYRFVGAVAIHEDTQEPVPVPVVPSPRWGIPPVRYARSGNVNIAYQVVGDGPLDVVFVMGWVSHVEEFWTEPSFARFLTRIAGFSRLIAFDKRGTGLSDRIAELPTLEQRMDDVRAVMDAVGSTRAALLGVSEGGPMCSLFAATYPERTIALMMIGSYARRLWAPDYPWGPAEAERNHLYQQIERDWGGPLGIEERAPSRAADPAFRDWWAHYLRQGASPGAALALTRMNAEVDVREVLPLIRVPTLVLHRSGDRCLRVEEGRYVASRIPGARFVEVAGIDHLPFVGDQEALLTEIEGFLGAFGCGAGEEGALATVLSLHHHGSGPVSHVTPVVATIAAQHRGELFSAGDAPPLVTFDGPARAIRAGLSIVSALATARVPTSGGLHTGECVRRHGHVNGVAVDVARAIALRAAPHELLLSGTVKDLVAGAAFRFFARGRQSVRRDAAEWRVYGVEATPPAKKADHHAGR
jgi:DNA-binding winged helix-turn-helix (wHTH) protein/pimeloyl-ACP methyl ester carboxylesterase